MWKPSAKDINGNAEALLQEILPCGAHQTALENFVRSVVLSVGLRLALIADEVASKNRA